MVTHRWCLDGVRGVALKLLDDNVLFYPPEEHFDVPAMPVDVGNFEH